MVKVKNNDKTELLRSLGLIASISIIIGNVIGTGVFLKARVMTCNVGSPIWVIAAWVFGGILSLAGALTYAELAAMMPRAGGEVVFLKNAYGRVWSFLYGWMQTVIAKPGAQASVAVAFGIFLNDLLGGKFKQVIYTTQLFGSNFELTNLQLIAVGLIVLFTVINCATVAVSGWLATVLTLIKIGMILFVGVGAFWLADGNWLNLSAVNSGGTCEGIAASARVGGQNYSFIAGFGAAVLGALWGYDGWNNLTLVAGEVKNPQKNIPIALIGGMIVIALLYIFVNLAYFYVLTPTQVASVSAQSSVAREVAAKFLQAGLMSLLSIGLMSSSIGTLHTSMLTGARVPYAMAKDGVFFKIFGKVSKKSRIPVASLIMQSILACILALSGSFDTLTDYVIFGSWIFYGLTTASIFVFRRKFPHAARPYKAFGYPIIPLLFLVVTGWLLINTLITSLYQAIIGIVLILAGLPIYFLLTRGKNPDLTEGDKKLFK